MTSLDSRNVPAMTLGRLLQQDRDSSLVLESRVVCQASRLAVLVYSQVVEILGVAQREIVDLGASWVGTHSSLFNRRRIGHLNGSNEREHDDGLE